MYPLNAILVGGDADTERTLAEALVQLGVNVEAKFPNEDRAIEYACTTSSGNSPTLSQPRPRLFVIHLKNPKNSLPLKKLSSTFPGQPILALLGAGGDPANLIRVMREGATQVVMLPLRGDDFRAALECIRVQYGRAAVSTPSIAVSGVTGGSGATSLAINLAYEFAVQAQVHCILVEVAMQMGMLATYLDFEPKFTTCDLLNDLSTLDTYSLGGALTRVADNFDVLPGPHQAIKRMAVASDQVLQLVDLAKHLASVVVVDVPCTYDDFYFETLAGCDHVILVAQQKVPSIRALQLVRETLGRESNFVAPILVINSYDEKVQGFSAARLQELVNIPKLWTIAGDATAFDAAVNNGRPLRREAPQSPALADIDELMTYLLAEMGRDTRKDPNKTFFKKFFHAVGLK